MKLVIASLVVFLSPLLNACAQDTSIWSNFQLNADEKPKQTPWTEAASLSLNYGEGEESVDVDVAARYDWQISSRSTSTAFLRGVTHINDRSKKEEEVIRLGAGYHFEFGGVEADGSDTYGFSDVSISFQQNKVFPDVTSDPCVADITQVFCRDQQETRLVGAYSTAIIPGRWESNTPQVYPENAEKDAALRILPGSPPILYSASPVISVFYDEVLDAATDPETGVKIDGHAAGAALTLGAYLSPRFLDYRLEFKTSYQQIIAIDRAGSRKPGFPANADLFSASLDFNLGTSSVVDQYGWRPAIGIAYKSGADPLAGRVETEETVVAFKLTHRALGSKG